MMTTWCVWACGLDSSMVYSDVKTHDIWEGKVIIRNEIYFENIRSWRFRDIREGVTLRKLILRSLLECTINLTVDIDLAHLFFYALQRRECPWHILPHSFIHFTSITIKAPASPWMYNGWFIRAIDNRILLVTRQCGKRRSWMIFVDGCPHPHTR